MLYIILTVVLLVWLAILLTKRRMSWHSVLLGYSIGVYFADMTEVTLNLLLNLYKFPTKLLSDPIFDNELGIIFSDTIILPIALIIFLFYGKKEHPWKTSLPFSILFILLEIFFEKLGYLTYLHWHLLFSATVYITTFYILARLTPRIAAYDPPIPYPARLLVFSHNIIMWVGALLSMPLLRLYQFRPGIFQDFMADCRFTDLLSGDVLGLILVLSIPFVKDKIKPLLFILTACLGTAFALYAYYRGWLIYRHWNHLLTTLRYFVPIFLILLYDRWERNYKKSIKGLA